MRTVNVLVSVHVTVLDKVTDDQIEREIEKSLVNETSIIETAVAAVRE